MSDVTMSDATMKEENPIIVFYDKGADKCAGKCTEKCTEKSYNALSQSIVDLLTTYPYCAPNGTKLKPCIYHSKCLNELGVSEVCRRDIEPIYGIFVDGK